MCESVVPCYETPSPQKYRHLSLLLLDCWQREYDSRPYRNFIFERLMFEERIQRLYDPVRDFATIVRFIETRSQLLSIKIVGLEIVSYEIELLQKFVESFSNLRSIQLKLMILPTEFFALLAKTVDQMSVEELVLEGTPLNDNDIIWLRLYIINSRTLQYLHVGSCNINQYNFANLADAVHKSQSIKGFNCGRLLGNNLSLDSQKIAHLISSLIWQNKLQQLEMEKCELNSDDMEIIAEYLYNKNSKLFILNVAYNTIGPNGAEHLLKAISVSGTLKSLNMNGCGLGSHGGEYIAKYLSSCRSLESLRVQNNNIGAEAITLILLTMKKSLPLNNLHLWGNKYNPRTGSILRRLIEAGVISQDTLDITYSFDDTIPGWRVIPWR
ncbi:uncharacterized protein [Musca autumnalis]|uniref:uncharacterized protein n=1 Tax=Musca autumnalis TaxID=221902 RepID=UPI003CEAA560